MKKLCTIAMAGVLSGVLAGAGLGAEHFHSRVQAGSAPQAPEGKSSVPVAQKEYVQKRAAAKQRRDRAMEKRKQTANAPGGIRKLEKQ